MLKSFLSLWSSEDLLSLSVEQFDQMLESLHEMYHWSMNFVWTYEPGMSSKELYKKDVQINKAERAIRKQIVEHLTFAPGEGVSQSLVLMSVVKDAERIGDYCKNLTEVAEKLGAGFGEDRYTQAIREIEKKVDKLFSDTRECFSKDDIKIARSIHEDETALRKECKALIAEITASDDLAVKHAVSYAIATRFHKRIVGHLANITSAVSMPIHKLDYFDEDSAPKEKNGEK